MAMAGRPSQGEDDIEKRLRLGEDTTTEFKGVARSNFKADPRDLAKEIAALANTEGGRIFLGVEDDGTATGIGDRKQADRLMVQVTQICSDKISPPISCTFTKAEFRGRLLLIVDVPGFSPERPYLVAGEFLDRKEIGGTLPQQLQLAAAFLDRHVRSASHVEGWERQEEGAPPDIFVPQEVMREGLRNALMHRDYRATSQTRVFIFQDRLELINPGALLNRLTVDSIRRGITQRRNPSVCALLNRLRNVESAGVGIPEMIRAMRDCGLPEPEFDLSGGHFRVVLRGGRGGVP